VGVAVDFVKEQFRHCKAILVRGAAPQLLAAAGLPATPTDGGFIVADGSTPWPDVIDAFVKAVAAHKHYEREQDPSPV
jgi:catalase